MKAFLWILGICSLLLFAVFLLKDDVRRLFFSNTIIVQTRGNLSPKEVRIDWTAESGTDTLTIFSDGHETGEIYEAAGFNTFLIYHKGDYLGHFEQFKTNAFNAHTYTFMLQHEGDSVFLDLKIFGPDATL